MAEPFPSLAAPPTRRRRGNAPLLVAGLLMLGALFALANPWAGYEAEAWPWDAWYGADVPLRTQLIAGIWALTGLIAVLFSIAGPARLRALSVLALTSLLVLTGSFLGDGDALPWKWILAGTVLGAGLWMGRGAGATRGLPLAGGILVIWMFICTPETTADGSSSTQLGLFIREWRLLLTDPAEIGDRWPLFAAQNLLLICALFGWAIAVGLRGERLPRIAFLFLALALLTLSAQAPIELASTLTASDWAPGVLYGLFSHGWFLWLIAVFALVDVMRTRPGMDDLGFSL